MVAETMPVLVEFKGGPLDGDMLTLPSATPEYRVPSFRWPVGPNGVHVYRLAAAPKLPPLRYDYDGHREG